MINTEKIDEIDETIYWLRNILYDDALYPDFIKKKEAICNACKELIVLNEISKLIANSGIFAKRNYPCDLK